MSTEHERDGLAERLRPVGLQCHVKGKEDGISFSQGFAKHSQAESI
jgi:hypothetical protein